MPFRTTRRVEFRDTDTAGIVHFSVFFTYMETAEHEMLRSVGLSVLEREGEATTLSWPRVAASCDFQGAARFEDLLEIVVRVEHLGTKSVRYGFAITCQGAPVCTGRLTAVCCQIDASGDLQSIPIPDRVREKLSQLQAL